jgi:serine/threonine protein kinase
MLNPDIYFEKNNFSSIFDVTVLNDMTSRGVIWALSAKIRKPLIRTGSDPKDLKIATMKYADKSNGVFGFYNIVHELAVGLSVNTLKDRVPNFMYTWGGFVCSPPERNAKLANPSSSVEYKYKFEKMCVNSYENPQVILLNEFINGQSLRVLLDQKDFNYTMFLEIIFQLACAIDIAQKELSFIHNDLHSENVLVQILEYSVDFNYDGKTILSRFIPVIIDYGHATLEYNEMFLPAISETSLFSKRHGELPRQNDITDIFTLFRDADKFKERIKVDFPYYKLDDVIQKAYTQLQ